jgi:hypothetical protein
VDEQPLRWGSEGAAGLRVKAPRVCERGDWQPVVGDVGCHDAKTTSETAEGVNRTILIVHGCQISDFMVGV